MSAAAPLVVYNTLNGGTGDVVVEVEGEDLNFKIANIAASLSAKRSLLSQLDRCISTLEQELGDIKDGSIDDAALIALHSALPPEISEALIAAGFAVPAPPKLELTHEEETVTVKEDHEADSTASRASRRKSSIVEERQQQQSEDEQPENVGKRKSAGGSKKGEKEKGEKEKAEKEKGEKDKKHPEKKSAGDKKAHDRADDKKHHDDKKSHDRSSDKKHHDDRKSHDRGSDKKHKDDKKHTDDEIEEEEEEESEEESPETKKRHEAEMKAEKSRRAHRLAMELGLDAPPPQDMDAFSRVALVIWNKISAHRYAIIFRKPVNPRDAPGYDKIIKEPMDLSLIKTKIEEGKIGNLDELSRLLYLMCNNAMIFNGKNDDYYIYAKEVMDYAKSLLEAARRGEIIVDHLELGLVDNAFLPAPPSGRTTTGGKRRSVSMGGSIGGRRGSTAGLSEEEEERERPPPSKRKASAASSDEDEDVARRSHTQTPAARKRKREPSDNENNDSDSEEETNGYHSASEEDQYSSSDEKAGKSKRLRLSEPPSRGRGRPPGMKNKSATPQPAKPPAHSGKASKGGDSSKDKEAKRSHKRKGT